MNKRGQEGNALIGIIIAILVLVLVAYLLIKGFGLFTDPFENPDFDRVLVENTCSSYLSAGGSAYCFGSYMISKNAYINCAFAVKNYKIKVDGSESQTCEEVESAQGICTKLKDELGSKYDPKKIMVNRLPCYKEGGTEGTNHWNVQ